MVIDAFTYNGEEDLLDIRLNTLADVVDTFVLVEANRTFTGNVKPMQHLRLIDDSRFAPFNVLTVAVTDMPSAANAWQREAHQRNAILRGLERADKDAVVLVSDVDEIPTADGVTRAVDMVRAGELLPYFEQAFFYYSFNHRMPGRWFGTRAVNLAMVRQYTPQALRARGTAMVASSGWHFSYLGSIDAIKRKLAAFSHQEFNVAPFNTDGHIRAQIEHNVDFLRGQRMSLVEGTAHLPKYVQDNLDRFGKYVWQLAPTVTAPATTQPQEANQ